MWFIGAEVEQETRAPPPKKNPGSAPAMISVYISDLVSIRTCSSYSLRSYHSIVLEHPKGRMVSTVGAGSFSAAALKLWNSLPAHIRDVGSLCAFKILVQLQQPVVLFNRNNYFPLSF